MISILMYFNLVDSNTLKTIWKLSKCAYYYENEIIIKFTETFLHAIPSEYYNCLQHREIKFPTSLIKQLWRHRKIMDKKKTKNLGHAEVIVSDSVGSLFCARTCDTGRSCKSRLLSLKISVLNFSSLLPLVLVSWIYREWVQFSGYERRTVGKMMQKNIIWIR